MELLTRILEVTGILTYPVRPPLDIEPGPEPEGDSPAFLACTHELTETDTSVPEHVYRTCACRAFFTCERLDGRKERAA